MAYRGYLSLDGVEIANSSRVVAHLGRSVPVIDTGVFPHIDLVEGPSELYGLDPSEGGRDADGLVPVYDYLGFGHDHLYSLEYAPCDLEEDADDPTLFVIPESSDAAGEGLWTPPEGARRYGFGLMEVDGTCWGPAEICVGCADLVSYDDTWPGLRAFVGDTLYRPELAPWYTTQQPESGEFGGVWVMSIDGLDTTPVERQITQMAGSGASAGPHRDMGRTLTFDALLVACTHAGLVYGLSWLTCLLRATTTTDDASLRYLAANPSYSSVDVETLVREVYGVVLTQAPKITEEHTTGGRRHQQATIYRVTWEMAVLSPYAYLPSVDLDADWDEVVRQPVNWVHAADCVKPETCEDMPVLFSTECVPEEISVIDTPPPVCGGCLPVGEIDKYRYQIPTMTYPAQCSETVVSLSIRNTGENPLTLQAFLRVCGTDVRCEDNRFPLQVTGLPASAELVLDGVTGRYHVVYDERVRRPIGIVGTPTGAPWRPPIIDRSTCWDFIVQTASTSEFEVSMSLRDREA